MSFDSLSLLDYFFINIISISVIFSFIKGFTQSLLGLLTWIGATILTLVFFENLSNYLSEYLNKIEFLEKSGLSIMISTVLSIPFIFLVSLFILKKVRSLISADFQKSSIGNFLDKLFGIVYGLAFGLLIISILLITVNNISNNFKSSSFVKNSLSYPYIDQLINNYIIEYTPMLINETDEIIEENLD